MAKKQPKLRCPFCGQKELFVCVRCNKKVSSYYVIDKPKELTRQQKEFKKLIEYVERKSQEIFDMED